MPEVQAQPGHPSRPFPLDVGSLAANATAHVVEVKFSVTQDGTPFLDSSTKYHHCGDSTVAFIVGCAVAMAAPLGPKGEKPKNQQFDVNMEVLVDNKSTAIGGWTGLSREGVLIFERQVLGIWTFMNEQSTVAAKAYQKI